MKSSVTRFIVIGLIAYYLLSLIPTQKFMYNQDGLCKQGTATIVNNKVVCK